MRSQFASADRKEWKDRITRENFKDLPSTNYTEHLAACGDCQTSVFQFLDVRDSLDYLSHSYFHVAYYSADVPERCLDTDLGFYSIITNREKREGIVIGFCPWCGVELPTRISNRTGKSQPNRSNLAADKHG